MRKGEAMTNRTRHIAFFLPALNSGGAEHSFMTLANFLAAQGHHIDFLMVKREGVYLPRLNNNIRLVELGGTGMLRALFPLVGYMQKNRPEWIIAGLPGPNLMAIVAGYIARCIMASSPRIAISQHHPFSEKSRHATKLRSRIRHQLARFAYAGAERVIAVSNGVADDLAANTILKRAHISVIHNPVDSDAIREKAAEKPGHSWLEKRASPVIVSAGRLEAQKDFVTLTQALAQCNDYRLIILGEGPDLAMLKQLAQDNDLGSRIDFTGFVDNPYSYFARADCFVLSSHYEGFGNVIVEALATGTPVIATDCPYGPREILNNGEYGTLTPPGDAAALAHAIQSCVAQATDTGKDQRLNRAQSFDIAAIAERYLSCCD